MNDTYKTTTSICPYCGVDYSAIYEERPDGMWLKLECRKHGEYAERVESDAEFFKEGYELEYEPRINQLLIPITYRCNDACRYCYTMSNMPGCQPPDRTLEEILDVVRSFNGNITYIGGEPTMRHDLPDLIRRGKELGLRRFDVGTNAQKLADYEYVLKLKTHGLDFVFFSLNDIRYETRESVFQNKVKALENCRQAGLPVLLQRTVDDLAQVDSLWPFLEKYKRIVLGVYLRTVAPYGLDNTPSSVFVSDIIKHLGKERDWIKGATPFNRIIKLFGRKIKISSGVVDTRLLDPIDYKYLISDGRILSFRRGTRTDAVLLRAYAAAHGQGD